MTVATAEQKHAIGERILSNLEGLRGIGDAIDELSSDIRSEIAETLGGIAFEAIGEIVAAAIPGVVTK